MTKDYDSTLARIAGNIAAGLVTTQDSWNEHSVSREAVVIAQAIVKRCKELARAEAEARQPNFARAFFEANP